MASPLDVARYLVRLASPREDEDVDCLCHLRLQKLLYYLQAWHLVARGKPLFSGRIEAWMHGPVVREVYPVFRDYKYQSIPPKEGDDPAALAAHDKEFIRTVWDQYKQFSATALRDMTHQEAPWRDARANLGPQEPGNAEITHEAMRAFFSPKLNDQLAKIDPRIDPSTWEKSAAAIDAGRTTTTEEIRRGLQGHRSRSDPG